MIYLIVGVQPGGFFRLNYFLTSTRQRARKQREVMIHFRVFLLLPLIVAKSIMGGSVVPRQVGSNPFKD